MTRNCWLKKTPLETALLLVLSIAVPFLIILSLFYILFHFRVFGIGGAYNCNEICNKTGNESSPGTTPKPPTDPIPDPKPDPTLDSTPNLTPNPSIQDQDIELRENYDLCSQYLSSNYTDNVNYPFIASIMEYMYADDSQEQHYLCSAAIITSKWILCSSTCIRSQKQSSSNFNNLFVRAGSNYWAKDGSIHQIRNVLFEDLSELSTIAAIELANEFPIHPSIRPVMLSKSSYITNFGFGQMYTWKSDDTVPLKYRKKYGSIIYEPTLIYKDKECENYTTNNETFCAFSSTLLIEKRCTNYLGFPVINVKTLIGMLVKEICNSTIKNPLYLIYDISKKIPWIQNITKVEI